MICEIYHSGGLLATVSVSNSGVREELELIDSSVYTLLCFEAGNNSTDTYHLALQRRSPLPPESQVVDNDSVVAGQTISPVADSDVLSFEGAAGDTQFLTLSDIGNLSASMVAEVFDPSMQLLTTLAISDSGTEQTLELTDTGTYTVLLSEGGNNSTDTYNFSRQKLFPTAPASIPLLYDVSTGNQDISPIADSDVYVFDGLAGATIIVTLSDVGNSSASLTADVFDPSQEIIGTLSASNTGDSETISLIESGAYTVRVRENGNNNTDTYTLNLQCLIGPCVEEMLPDISVLPAAKNFGSVQTGTSSTPMLFTVMNNGDGKLKDITLNSSNSVFVISGDTCTGTEVMPGETCTFDAAFAPLAPGRIVGRLTLNSNDPETPSLGITVVGTGTGSCISCVEGSVSGIGVERVTCINLTTGDRVFITDGSSEWSCTARGLSVSPGDDVQIIVLGDAE